MSINFYMFLIYAGMKWIYFVSSRLVLEKLRQVWMGHIFLHVALINFITYGSRDFMRLKWSMEIFFAEHVEVYLGRIAYYQIYSLNAAIVWIEAPISLRKAEH